MELREGANDSVPAPDATTTAQDAGLTTPSSASLPAADVNADPPLGDPFSPSPRSNDEKSDPPSEPPSPTRLHRPSGPAGVFGDQNFGGEPEALGDRSMHGAYDAGCVFLTIEALATPIAKFAVSAVRVSIVLATVLLAVTTWWKLDVNQFSMLYDNTITTINVVVGSVILAALVGSCGYYLWGLRSVVRRGLRWNRRRRRYCILGGVNLLVDVLLTVFFLAPNAFAVAHPCSWWLLDMHLFTFFRTTFFAALIALQLLQALILMPASSIPYYKGPATVGIDLPTKAYVILFSVAFVPLEIITFFRLATETNWFDADYLCTKYYGTNSCDITAGCRQQEYPCVYPNSTHALAITGSVLTFLVICVYFAMVVVARRALTALPYRDNKISYVELGFQLQTRLIASFFYIAGLILLGLVKMNSCNSVMLTAIGHAPIILVLATMVALQAVLATPAAADPSALKLRAWLQDAAWTEDEIPTKLAERPFRGEPIFCYETALKCFYASALVYDIDEVPGTPFSADVALKMWNLRHQEILWIKEKDAKCFAAWDFETKTIVLALRGTASMKNVLADLKIWREAHPPVRGSYWLGTQPMVHRGFLETWDESGLKFQVLNLLKNLMLEGAASSRASSGLGRPNQEVQARPWRVIITGHSLGGAMAHLASYDISQKLGSRVNIVCYTYGCPRTGNHAFARSFRAAVPDCWDIYHADDPVSTEFKFVFLYKRGAHRVILLRRGEMLVRPLPAELVVRRGSPRLAEHLLSTYAASLGAILKSKMDHERKQSSRGGRAGRRAVTTTAELRALVRREYVQEVFLSTHALRQASLLRMAGANASRIERAELEDVAHEADYVKEQGCFKHEAVVARAMDRVVSKVKEQGQQITGLYPTAAELEMSVQD